MRWRCLLLLLLSLAAPAWATPTRVVHDMAGDPVRVPQRIERVVTLGATPVLNSLVFAVGRGEHIVNGLPGFARQPRWGYQYRFAPHLIGRPSLSNVGRTPNLEALLGAAPDLVLTMDRSSAQSLRRLGLPAFQLSWSQPDEVKTAITLLGGLLDNPAAAERYVARFDALVGEVETALHAQPLPRPRVLYFNPKTLSRPHLIAEWWIRTGGGDSVTADRGAHAGAFGLEQLLAWDPDILIVSGSEELESVHRDRRFARLRAVRTGRVLVAPCGAHSWGNRTAEQPLMALWAAHQFHPQAVRHIDLVERTRDFYRDLFGVALSRAQAGEILAGGPQAAPLLP
ncbi:ABC transporter substrate-binding protein [Flavobacterium sp. MXW15]|uniref:ABC transporter substrate-binding protein n=1 Tax=Xanthomonas chitinilytica TaxID=2989819 RepID=A0ABT3JVK9_9XANT|nr:ABC transporter substrate-binding protein [Xanthomonas sp. H13-6]MCW4454859.1 ABC transporter substrate-binding protein [Flavobacterium sp. MXW15]MCW4472513.1 ABC transporter substrate-binding protein [Xanthomonas sp. H13-6]